MTLITERNWVINRQDLEAVKKCLKIYPDRVLLVDTQKQVLWANELVLENRDSILGLYCSDLISNEKSLCESCHLQQAIESKQLSKELRVIMKGHKEVICENWAVPIIEDDGSVKQLILINRKLPDYYDDELLIKWFPQWKQSDNQLALAVKQVGKTFHDIRNPLNGIYGVIQLMKDTDFPEAHQELYHMLTVSYEGMINIVENAEKNVQNADGVNRFLPEDFSVRKMVMSVLEPYKNRASRREILLKHISPPIEKDMVRTDRYRLIQLMSFWTEVFIDCIYRGTVEIQIQASDNQKKHGLRIEFIGHGIIQKPLFDYGHTHMSGIHLTDTQYEIFSQLQSILNVRELHVQEDAESLVYSFWLPIIHLSSQTPQMDVAIAKKNEVKKGTSGVKRYKLLIVEDDFLSRMTYQLTLNKQYDIDFAKTGLESISMYMNSKPDLIILDIMLPDINGFEVFERIESFDKQHPPIIACTARVLDTESSYLRSYGFSDYLAKPIQNKDLKQMLEQYLV
jgi:CheY-like chemotaxis protein/nitrogen-specific signal transduction histidine kinase